jgi:chromosome partitioning protein
VVDRPEEEDVESKKLPVGAKGNTMPARWLILASAKGGSGKTTAARNLAVQAADVGLNVLLIDLDRQQTLTQWFQRRPADAKALQLLKLPLRDFEENVTDIDRGIVEEGIDLVIVDTPPGVEEQAVPVRILLRKATLVLVPSGQGTPDLSAVIDWMRFLKKETIPAAFLLNRVKRSARSYHSAKLALNRSGTLCPIEVRDLEDIQMTYDHGLGVAEVRGAAGAEDFRGVWEFVSQRLGVLDGDRLHKIEPAKSDDIN